MAQHYREIVSIHPDGNREYTTDVHLCSVTDFVSIEGGAYIYDGYKIAAAIIDGMRYHGLSIDEQFQMIRDQIADWDMNEDNP